MCGISVPGVAGCRDAGDGDGGRLCPGVSPPDTWGFWDTVLRLSGSPWCLPPDDRFPRARGGRRGRAGCPLCTGSAVPGQRARLLPCACSAAFPAAPFVALFFFLPFFFFFFSLQDPCTWQLSSESEFYFLGCFLLLLLLLM